MSSFHSDGIDSASLCVKKMKYDSGKTWPLDFRLNLKIIIVIIFLEFRYYLY